MASRPDALPDESTLEARARRLFAAWDCLEQLGHVEVWWNPRLRTTAGRAIPLKLRIELNPTLLARAVDRIDEVLAHEAAHLAATLRYGRRIRAHGPEWAGLLAQAGWPVRVTHDLPVAGLRRGRSLFLRICVACSDRWINAKATPEACARCRRSEVRVFRAPRSEAGRAALQRFTPNDPVGYGGAPDEPRS
ncbi:MAG: SprT-like domain-containing protein [Planctomycetes bacterium]|nr:SprT-like domain-containing protein [Planctomycetota bacterium]